MSGLPQADGTYYQHRLVAVEILLDIHVAHALHMPQQSTGLLELLLVLRRGATTSILYLAVLLEVSGGTLATAADGLAYFFRWE